MSTRSYSESVLMEAIFDDDYVPHNASPLSKIVSPGTAFLAGTNTEQNTIHNLREGFS